MNRTIPIIVCTFALLLPPLLGGGQEGAYATTYCGRVVNSAGEPLPYATVYPINDPVSGTATNNDGYFSFEAFLASGSEVVISYIGYEKASVSESILRQIQDTLLLYSSTSPTGALPPTIVLSEQPIGLEEMVVSAKQPKYANKRKQMALLLRAVHEQLQSDWPITPTAYRMVSDVRMDSEDKPWGIEQMIATVVTLPFNTLPPSYNPQSTIAGTAHNSPSGALDSLQFRGEYCKRYFAPTIRRLADSIYTTDILEQMGTKTRKAAVAIDSGVVVHKGLFMAGNVRAEFEEYMNDVRHWSVNKENDSVTVLTYSVKKNFLFIFNVQYTAHFIVDSRTLRMERSAEQLKMKVTIPFGIKLDAGQLAMLNMLNLSEQQINKFRLRQATADIHFNTLYQTIDEHIYVLEKNLHTDAVIIGARKQTIPVKIHATQRMTQVTPNTIPLTRDQLTRQLQREIVEIY